MQDSVKRLAGELVAIIDCKDVNKTPEQKLAQVKSYLLGLQDGIDYLAERMATTTRVSIREPQVASRVPDLVYTCTQCGGKTTRPVFFPDQFMVSRRPYCTDCASKKLNQEE